MRHRAGRIRSASASRRGRCGVGVGSGEGRVTTNVGELRLWFPAASRARICTTCWPLSSLNQCSFASRLGGGRHFKAVEPNAVADHADIVGRPRAT